jgi:hypothetical protein
VKRKLFVIGLFISTALAGPASEVAAQAQPSPVPVRPAPTATPSTVRPAPRAGGFPMELAFPLLAGGAASLGGGLYLLKRGKRD